MCCRWSEFAPAVQHIPPKPAGRVVVVGNDEIREAQAALCAQGIWAEPTGAVAYAGFRQLGGTTDDLAVVTGHGIKAAG